MKDKRAYKDDCALSLPHEFVSDRLFSGLGRKRDRNLYVICIYVYTYIIIYIYIHLYMYMYMCVCMYMYNTCVYIYIYIYMYTYVVAWLRTNGINTNGASAKVMSFDRLGKKVHIYIYIYIYIYITHTCMHLYMYTYMPWHFWEAKSMLTGLPRKSPCKQT